MQEIWKEINNFNSKYSISNMGRLINNKSKLIKKPYAEPGGYKIFSLILNKKQSKVYLHRLMAEAFIENVNNKPCVNHKDGDKLNNNIDNLEWVTYSENLIHAFENKLNNIRRHCLQVLLDGFILNEYESCRQASRNTGVSHQSIYLALKGKNKTAGGFIWK